MTQSADKQDTLQTPAAADTEQANVDASANQTNANADIEQANADVDIDQANADTCAQTSPEGNPNEKTNPATRKPRIILASASPRRRELLEQAGVEFSVQVSEVDETLEPELAAKPLEAVEQLAERKAGVVVQEILNELNPSEPTVVIGADTMVVLDNQIFGKPANFSHAKGMLRKLSGHTHQVMTGVSLWVALAADSTNPENVTVGHRSFVDVSDVTFRELTDKEIDEYLAKGESYDKAGAYAVQGEGAALVSHVEGSLDTVIGLPANRLTKEFPDLLGIGQ